VRLKGRKSTTGGGSLLEGRFAAGYACFWGRENSQIVLVLDTVGRRANGYTSAVATRVAVADGQAATFKTSLLTRNLM